MICANDCCLQYSRLGEDVEHGETLGRLGRVQVVQSGHGVDDAKHHSCFHPVIHKVGVGQTSCKEKASSPQAH